MSGHDAHHDGGHHDEAFYKRIWAILLVLLVISVMGPWLGNPVITLITAFGIAGVKAYMVMKHFMHLDQELPLVRYILVTSVVFMAMFFAATGVDVMNHEGARWSNEAAKAAIERGMAYGDPAGHHAGGHGDHGEDAHGGDDHGEAAHGAEH